MKVLLCFSLVCLIVYVKSANKQRAVNVALETVIEFDNKANDLKLIDDVQTFLNKVKNVLGSDLVLRRHMERNEMKFTDFLQNAMKILKTYDDEDLEDVFDVIDDEIRDFHYDGCKVPELLENTSMRRFMTNKLEEFKEIPAHKIRQGLNKVLKMLHRKKLDKHDLEFINFVNSLYSTDETQKFLNVINNLEFYKSGSKRSEIDLRNIVKHGIRNVFFDHYSSLNTNLRRELKVRIESYWHNGNNPDVKNDHRIYNILKKNGPTTTTKVKIFNIEITPAPENELELEHFNSLRELSPEVTTQKIDVIFNNDSKTEVEPRQEFQRIKPVFETYYKKEEYLKKPKYLDQSNKKKYNIEPKEILRNGKLKYKKHHRKHKSKTVQLVQRTIQPSMQTIYEENYTRRKKHYISEERVISQLKIRATSKEDLQKQPTKVTKYMQTVFADDYADAEPKRHVPKKAKIKNAKKLLANKKVKAITLKEPTTNEYNHVDKKGKKRKLKKKTAVDEVSSEENLETKKSKLQTIWVEKRFTRKANKHLHHKKKKSRYRANSDEDTIIIKSPNVKRVKNAPLAKQKSSDESVKILSDDVNGQKTAKAYKSDEQVIQKRHKTTKFRKFIPLAMSNEGLTIESFESLVHRKSNANDSFTVSITATANTERLEETTIHEPLTAQIDGIEKDLVGLRSELIVRNITEILQGTTPESLFTNSTINQEAEALASLEAKRFAELDFWEGTTKRVTKIKKPTTIYTYITIPTKRLTTTTITTTPPSSSSSTITTISSTTSTTPITTPTISTTTTSTAPTTTSNTPTTTIIATTTKLTTSTTAANTIAPNFRAGINEVENKVQNSSSKSGLEAKWMTGILLNNKPPFPLKNDTNKVLLINNNVVKNTDLKINVTLQTTTELLDVVSTTVKTSLDNFLNISKTVDEDLPKEKISDALRRKYKDLSNFSEIFSKNNDAYSEIREMFPDDNLMRK